MKEREAQRRYPYDVVRTPHGWRFQCRGRDLDNNRCHESQSGPDRKKVVTKAARHQAAHVKHDLEERL